MALSGDGRTQSQTDAELHRVLRVPPPYGYRCPYGTKSNEACASRNVQDIGDTIRRAGSDHVAAVLMEPNAGTNGIVAANNYWPELRALTRELEVYLIADEVMSGFGRCGEWFAWQASGEAGRPDLMTLATGLTGAHVPFGRRRIVPGGGRALGARNAQYRPHLLRAPAGLCGRHRGHRGLSGRAIDRTFKNAGRVQA